MYDSSKGGMNTYENFIDKKINENHNARASMMTVQMLGHSEFAYETKMSTSTRQVENYVSKRIEHLCDGVGSTGYSVANE